MENIMISILEGDLGYMDIEVSNQITGLKLLEILAQVKKLNAANKKIKVVNKKMILNLEKTLEESGMKTGYIIEIVKGN